MATTHVFIVDANTFKYHVEYLFVGTGAQDNVIDFNDSKSTKLHHKTESTLIGLIADSQRMRIGDFVIFYLQQNFAQNIKEGKFYGVFKIKEAPAFLDNNNRLQYLHSELCKSLTFRAIIEPYHVYAEGVTEWEALDEIKHIQSPNQMLWSLIYRKLKGNRGNTMITIYESERLINLIRTKNDRTILQGDTFTFNVDTQKIENTSIAVQYKGNRETINVLPRLIKKYEEGKQFEAHLQTYILQNLENIGLFDETHVEWIGNEVSCGVGMQKIDIMISLATDNRKIVPIELKSVYAYPEIVVQIQRYVDWLEQYYLSNRPSDIEPMIISRKIDDKKSDYYFSLINAIKDFNNKNSVLQIRYIEFEVDEKTIVFMEVKY